MKNKLFIIIFIVVIVLLLFPKPQTLYSGKYYAGSTNEEIVLNPNNSFDFYISGNRSGISISGKYRVLNNHIVLTVTNKDDEFYIDKISSGDITGSVITFKKSSKDLPIIFTKS